MKFMIFGSGNAREYATFRRLKEECESESPLLATTTSPALLAGEPGVHTVSNVDEAIGLCQRHRVDCAIVISPNPAFDGAVDQFNERGISTIGPTAMDAALEKSKAFAGEFAAAASIPRPFAANARNGEHALELLRRHWRADRNLVVKADDFVDNAAFRTIVPSSFEEAVAAIDAIRLHVGRDCPFVLQERLEGPELSVHVAFDGSDYLMLPPVSDYKRLSMDPTSPMTHGMGAVARASATFDPQLAAIEASLRRYVVEPTLEGMAAREISYRGILYIGAMLTAEGPKVLEFNVRPGNPEWLCLLALLESPLAELFEAIRYGRISSTAARFKTGYSVSMFAVDRGYPLYPSESAGSQPIEGLEGAGQHARIEGESARRSGGKVLAGSGRVISATAFHELLGGARDAVLRAMHALSFDGKKFRADIGLSWPLAETSTTGAE